MSVDHILSELKNRESKKEDLLNQLLEDCKLIIDKLSHFKDSPSTFRPKFPDGVVGRRLSDKIYHFENIIDSSLRIEKFSLKDLEKLEKALMLVQEHFKKHENIFPLEEDLVFPEAIEDIKNEFIILNSLQSNLKSSYIENCIQELKHKVTQSNDRMEKLDIKQTYEVYVQLLKTMPFDSIFRLKLLNDEYGNILSPGFIAREFKSCSDRIYQVDETLRNILSEKEKFKESAKHLTHLEKCETKSRAYTMEIDKYSKKLELLDEDSRQEIQELVYSYTDAYKIMQEEILKIQNFISKEYGISNVEDYHKKSNSIQVQEANLEIESKKLEKRSKLLESVLYDIHESRRKTHSDANGQPSLPYTPKFKGKPPR